MLKILISKIGLWLPKINITVKESTDFTGKEFKRNEEGCGLQKNQKGKQKDIYVKHMNMQRIKQNGKQQMTGVKIVDMNSKYLLRKN